jgi:hypothetical protein
MPLAEVLMKVTLRSSRSMAEPLAEELVEVTVDGENVIILDSQNRQQSVTFGGK